MSSFLLFEETVAPPKPIYAPLPIDAREAVNWQSRQGNTPTCVVEHIAVAPNFEGLVNYLISENAPEVSATFVVGGDFVGQFALLVGSGYIQGGNLLELSREQFLRAANHCGIQSFPNSNPRPSVGNCNWFTWGKEHVGYPGQIWTEAMIQNDILCNQYVLSCLGKSAFTYIVGHNAFDPNNRANCPGPTFPWNRIYPDRALRRDLSNPEVIAAMARIPRNRLESLPIGDHEAYEALLKEFIES